MADKCHLRQAFQKAAKNWHRKLVVAFSGLALMTGCGTAPVRPQPADHHAVPAVSVVQDPPSRSRPFPPETEALFARNLQLPANSNQTTEARMKAYMDKLCFSLGDDTTLAQKNIEQALKALKELPVLGAPLVEYAAAQNIQFCALSELPAGVGAQYMSGLGAILASDADNSVVMMLRVAHEIVHARQDNTDLLTYYYNWDIENRVARNLTIEAAAVTSEMLIAFEAKQRGDNSVWDHLRQRYSDGVYADAEIYDRIENAWNGAKASGKGDMEAYAAAGQAGFERVFDVEGWRLFYLNHELLSYLSDITSGKLDNIRTFSTDGFDTDKRAAAGRLNNAGDVFTQTARAPDLQNLLARHEKIKWAYEAAEIARYQRVFGKDHQKTKERQTAAAHGNNPYLALDLKAVLAHAQQAAFPAAGVKKRFAYLYEYMDEAVQPPATKAPASGTPPGPKSAPPETKLARPTIKAPPAA